MIICLSSFAYATIYTNDPDLIGYWKVDDSSTTIADSSNAGSNGVYNGVLNQKSPLVSYSTYSLGFDGNNDLVTVDIKPKLRTITTTKGFTWGCWLNQTNDYPSIMGNNYYNDPSSTYYGFNLRNIAGENTISCSVTNNGASSDSAELYESLRYMFLLCKVNSTGISLYLNGTQRAYVTPFTYGGYGVGPNERLLRIGSGEYPAGTYTGFFAGELDECFLINRSLTDTEILGLYNNGFGSNITPLPPFTFSFPGTLIENNLFQNNFIYSGNSYTKLNLTFITAEAKTIYLNFSNQGDLNREGYLNFTIKGFTFNSTAFSFQENFTNSTPVSMRGGTYPSNISIYGNATSDAIEDFEDGNYKGWNITSEGSSTSVDTGVDGNKYLRLYASISNTGTITYGGYSLDSFDLRYTYQFTSNSWFHCSAGGFPGEGFGDNYIYISDGITDILIWNQHCSVPEDKTTYLNISGIKTVANSISVYGSTGSLGSFSLSTLDLNRVWRIKIRGSASGNNYEPASGTSDSRIYSLSMSGTKLKLVANYTINNNFNFTSNSLVSSIGTISFATLNATVYQPEGTLIRFYMSSDNTNYEEITNGVSNTFETAGINLSVRFSLNTPLYNVTPIVYSYSIIVSSASVSGLYVFVGSDDIRDMYINYTINGSTSPINYTGNGSGITNHINSSCLSSSYCLIPISLVSTSGGIVELSNFNLTRNINPISLNVSAIQDLNNITLSPTYTGGAVSFSDSKFDYRGSKDITVYAHNSDYTSSINRTIFVKYSKFNLSYPSGFNYWQIFPKKRNQSGIEPYGQNSTAGVWRIDNLAYDSNVDIYARYNSSTNLSCVTNMNFRGQNFTRSSYNNQSTLNISNLTTSSQKIVENLSTATYGNIRTYTQINCSAYGGAFIIPNFCFFSICTDCVRTNDYQSNCEAIE